MTSVPATPNDPTDRQRLELIDIIAKGDGQDWPHFWESGQQRQIGETMYGPIADALLASSWYVGLVAERARANQAETELAQVVADIQDADERNLAEIIQLGDSIERVRALCNDSRNPIPVADITAALGAVLDDTNPAKGPNDVA